MTDLVSRLVSLLLEETTTDENLEETVRGFLQTTREPTFPVKQDHIKIVEDNWSGTLTWKALTTNLARRGLAFGDVVREGDSLHRVVADADTSVWRTASTTTDVISQSSSQGEKYDRGPDVDAFRRKLYYVINHPDVIDRVRDELEKIPEFAVPQNGLRFGVNKFDWDHMTVRLQELGFAFGDVVVDGETQHLHRVVAWEDGHLWITSSQVENSITYSDCPDNFKKL